MKIIQSQIKGVFTLEPQIFQDERGYFMESYNDKSFSRISGLNISFVQDNESKSNKDVLRGLHFQIPPYAQDKLVRVIKGSVLDVAVDIRTGSPTFGKYVTELLSEQNKKQFFIPKGFAHGFLVLEDQTIFSYKCSNFYHPQFERSLKWNDPEINIEWKNSKPMLSEKDREIDASLSDFKDVFT
ncbi:MAG: dTDP-4-dehydrorhamnose 3,5-epimerase [Flavobacteriales bacterium]|nr:dTDP-4-dehydrorhamnose 3,5-epimerase [Flavobacteriales bacterium]